MINALTKSANALFVLGIAAGLIATLIFLAVGAGMVLGLIPFGAPPRAIIDLCLLSLWCNVLAGVATIVAHALPRTEASHD